MTAMDMGQATRTGWSGARAFAAFVAAVGLASLVLRYSQVVSAMGFGPGTVRFFSFFTILSNTLATLVAGLAALVPASALGRFAQRPAVATAPTLYMLITGILYSLLLRNLESLTGWEQVANVGLHYVMPVLVLLYWFFCMKKGELKIVHVAWWLVFPIAYAAFTLVQGPVVNWYPYPFIDASVLTPMQLAINIFAVVVFAVLVGLVLVAIDAWLRRGRVAGAASG